MQQVPPDAVNGIFPDHDAPELIEPGVWRIPLPLPMALRSVNLYLLAGGGEWALVDAGLGTPDGEAALAAGLQRAGIGAEHITTLVLTHAHPDHIGLAGPLHAASAAPVRMLEPEAERLFHVWDDASMEALRVTNTMYAAHGMPQDDLEQSAQSNRRVRRVLHLPPPDAVVPLADGDVVRLAGSAYQAIWTPGHSDYHLCLLRDDGLFFAGDHVLPRITPNIGLYPGGRPNPLRDYYQALARVRDLPVRLVLPGHGRPFTDLAGRVDELRAHHEARAGEALELLATHAAGADAFTVAAELFGTRLRTADDRRFALAETLAHLEDLRERGAIERREVADHVTYAVVTAHVPLDR